MKSNYKQLGQFIRQVDIRNSEGKEENLLGVSVQKKFIPSIANTVGTDFKKYKVVKKGQFTYIPDTSRRGAKIGIALLEDYEEGLVSNVYTVFEIIDEKQLIPEYLMLWFSRPEFDRYARFKSHGSVREVMDWDEMCKVELPVPPYEKQKEIVDGYKTITERIALKQKINDNLADTANAIFIKSFLQNTNKENWAIGCFRDLILDTFGGDWGKETPSGNYTQEVCCIRGTDIPFLNMGSISDAPTRYILPKNFENKKINANNMVVEISGGSPVQATGRIALVPGQVLTYRGNNLICSNFCRVVSVKLKYVYYFLQNWIYLYRNGRMFDFENSSTGLKNFDFTSFVENIEVFMPPENDIEVFNRHIEPIYKEIFRTGFEIESLKQLKSHILPQLMVHGI